MRDPRDEEHELLSNRCRFERPAVSVRAGKVFDPTSFIDITVNSPALVERTDTYLNAAWRGLSAHPSNKPVRPFVTISRENGSGGTNMARLLAVELNRGVPVEDMWRIYEGNLTTRMLKYYHLPAHLAKYLPEDRISEVNASVGEIVGLHPNLWELVEKTNLTIRQIALEGHAIIVGRASAYATAGLPDGVHVRLVAPVANRAHSLAQLYNISEADAAAFNARYDHGRRRYAKNTFNADITDPLAYDLVINTGRVSFAEAAKLVAARVQMQVAAAR